MAKGFVDLEVWRKAHQLVLKIYRATKNYPTEERFGLVSQMRRAAVSVTANIAEGFRRYGKSDKSKFYNVAQSSLDEVQYYVLLSKDLGYLADIQSFMQDIEEAARMLTGLVKSIGVR